MHFVTKTNGYGTRGQGLINARVLIPSMWFILLPYCRGNIHNLAGEYPGSEPAGEDASIRYHASESRRHEPIFDIKHAA